MFPSDNWWNVDVSSAPVDPKSGQFLDFIGRGTPLHPDFGGIADSPPEIYGMVYLSVPGTQPLVPVTFVEFGDESDDGRSRASSGLSHSRCGQDPARLDRRRISRQRGSDGDRHILIVDRDRRLLFELYHTFWDASANRWEAGSGAVFHLDTNARRTEGWTSADAAGLAILPGLVRYDEVFGPDPIRHAFRFTVRRTNGTSSRPLTPRATRRALRPWGPACASRRARTSPGIRPKSRRSSRP